tara:strand:+ start:5425 stop:6222 length:798 start_codon:yes stop_codon:yes gene_type:complete
MKNLINYSQKAKLFSYQSRIDIAKIVHKAKGGHIGGSLSVIDILSSIYALNQISEFEFILSKGHCLLAWLVTLIRTGEIDKSDLDDYYQNNSRFGGHPKKGSLKSITWSTGSLGHGLSVSCGKALANKNKKFICVIGDGEANEGSIWEGFMFMAQHKISNLLVIIDNNKQESLDFTDNILSISDVSKRLDAIGLDAKNIDGHCTDELVTNINQFLSNSHIKIPKVFVANTIKGKGISFMERDPKWHHRKIKDDELIQAIKELEVK